MAANCVFLSTAGLASPDLNSPVGKTSMAFSSGGSEPAAGSRLTVIWPPWPMTDVISRVMAVNAPFWGWGGVLY